MNPVSFLHLSPNPPILLLLLLLAILAAVIHIWRNILMDVGRPLGLLGDLTHREMEGKLEEGLIIFNNPSVRFK